MLGSNLPAVLKATLVTLAVALSYQHVKLEPEVTPRIHYVQATESTGDGASTLALKPMG